MGGGVSDKQLLTKIQVGSLKKCNSFTFFLFILRMIFLLIIELITVSLASFLFWSLTDDDEVQPEMTDHVMVGWVFSGSIMI